MKSPLEICKVSRNGISNDLPFCFEDCIVTIANYVKRDYQFMFSGSWNVCFKQLNSMDKIKVGSEHLKEANMRSKKLHGLALEEIDLKQNEIVQSFELMLKKGKVILVKLDAFYIPWDMFYQKGHFTHYFIINGYDSKCKKFICTDPFYDMVDKEMQYDEVLIALEKAYDYVLSDATATKEGVIAEIVGCAENIMDRYVKEGTDNAIVKLENIFKQANKIIKAEDDNFWTLPIFDTVDCMIIERHKYLLSLEYAQNKMGIQVDQEAMEIAESIIANWSIIRGMLIKAFCFEEMQLRLFHQIGDLISDIISDEKKFAQAIIFNDFTKKKEVSQVEQEVEKTKANEEEYSVNLVPYFNNLAFDSYPPKEKDSNLTGCGHYFILESPETHPLLQLDKNVLQNHYDNISCFGQKIEFELGVYKRIILYLNAEFGNFRVKFKFNQGDKVVDEKMLYVRDWLRSTEQDTIFFRGSIATKSEEGVKIESRKHVIYKTEIILNADEEIDSIVTPSCPNVHIFGISFIKEVD